MVVVEVGGGGGGGWGGGLHLHPCRPQCRSLRLNHWFKGQEDGVSHPSTDRGAHLEMRGRVGKLVNTLPTVGMLATGSLSLADLFHGRIGSRHKFNLSQ